MGDSQKGHLPLDELRRVEFEYARSRYRNKFWMHGTPRSAAIGLFLKSLLNFRASIAANSTALLPIHAQDLSAASKSASLATRGEETILSQTKLSALLRGLGLGVDPFSNELGSLLVRLILLGAVAVPEGISDEELVVANRITDFFFPTTKGPRQRPGFFEEAFKGHTEPLRTAEAISEIYALAYALRTARSEGYPDTKATIVRTSGSTRFLQVDAEGQLTSSGIATIEALKCGVEVWFVFPKATIAEKSYSWFLKRAKEQLQGVELKNLKRKRLSLSTVRRKGSERFWAGDFLSRIIRFVYHECFPPPSLGVEPWRNLFISRSPRHGPTAWDPSEDEILQFSRWFDAIK